MLSEKILMKDLYRRLSIRVRLYEEIYTDFRF